MNLIEKLGGYEQAKSERDKINYSLNNGDFVGGGSPKEYLYERLSLIEIDLLEYRRANNIFEVGDIAVGKDYDDFDDALLTITEKFNHCGKPSVVFECERTICDDFESELRHATTEEIEAGHRL